MSWNLLIKGTKKVTKSGYPNVHSMFLTWLDVCLYVH